MLAATTMIKLLSSRVPVGPGDRGAWPDRALDTLTRVHQAPYRAWLTIRNQGHYLATAVLIAPAALPPSSVGT